MSLGAALGQLAPGTYNRDDILSDVVKTSYGLGADATPNDIFGKLADAVLSTGETAGGQSAPVCQIIKGSYIGNEQSSLPFNVIPNWNILFIFGEGNYGAVQFAILVKIKETGGALLSNLGGIEEFNISSENKIQIVRGANFLNALNVTYYTIYLF